MNILITGKNGQVGQSLVRTFAPHYNITAVGREDLDLSHVSSILPKLAAFRPNVIINAAAYTGVDQAETEQQMAFAVNHLAVAQMAEYCRMSNAVLIHYSTDYVFDGKKDGQYLETDKTNPLSIYGQSKRLGEEALRDSGSRHMIFRTSWVYSGPGKNFANTILKLAAERDQLSVVNDQVGCPTHADTIANITMRCLSHYSSSEEIARTQMNGLYHLTEKGTTTWFEFARYLISGAIARGTELACRPDRVEPISTSKFGAPAQRPLNSSLDCSRLCEQFDLALLSWQDAAEKFLDDWVKRR